MASFATFFSLGILFAKKNDKKPLTPTKKKVSTFFDKVLECSEGASKKIQETLQEPEVQKVLKAGRAKAEQMFAKLKDKVPAAQRKELGNLIEKAKKKLAGKR